MFETVLSVGSLVNDLLLDFYFHKFDKEIIDFSVASVF